MLSFSSYFLNKIFVSVFLVTILIRFHDFLKSLEFYGFWKNQVSTADIYKSWFTENHLFSFLFSLVDMFFFWKSNPCLLMQYNLVF